MLWAKVVGDDREGKGFGVLRVIDELIVVVWLVIHHREGVNLSFENDEILLWRILKDCVWC